MKQCLLLGAGYSARAFARMVAREGVDCVGTTRSAEGGERLRRAGIRPLVLADESDWRDLHKRLADASHVIVSAAPGDEGDPFLGAVRDVVSDGRRSRDLWVGYLSTVGVYGDHGGGWVDEETQPAPRSPRSLARLETEENWRDLAQKAGFALAILRLSGIYGPGRNAFVNLANGTAKRLVKPGQVFNRIHVDDIAGALAHLGDGRVAGTFNVTDDLPAPPQDVVAYAAGRMGVAPPPEMPFEEAAISPMARSFYGENKRVANGRLAETGYRLRYPDYRAGLDTLWESGHWESEPAA